MSGSPPPQDNSVELARVEQQAAERARQQQQEEKAAERARFESSLGSAYNNSIEDARQYFQSRGLNPDDYIGSIQRGATSARGRVPDLASAPGTYFDNLGATVYEGERGGKRAQFMRDINSFAGDGFSSRRIGSDADDATIEAILAEQRQSADNYIRNLLDRGVITSSGYGAAGKNLENQGYGARARLEEVGAGELERGRSSANELASEARQRASNYELGESFNPYDYSTQLDSLFGDFFEGLGGRVRSKAPTNLFDTAGLAGIAGAAQGAGNTAFNPAALAGIFGDDEDEDEETNNLLNAF